MKLLSPAKRNGDDEDIVLLKRKAVAKGDDEGVLTLRQKQQDFGALMQIAPSELFKKSPECANRDAC